ncbi:MAG: GNAT family N-acetyltransferase [Bacteroidia bacterium]
MLTVKFAQTPDEHRMAYEVRWEVLRKPWNQPKGSETDEMESTAHTIIATENGITCATGRLQASGEHTGQIRYMAVNPNMQGKGLGKKVLLALEAKAVELGMKSIVLNARENAVNFYLQNGYHITGDAETLYGVIRHLRMEKKLN